MADNKYFFGKDIPVSQVAEGATRQVLAYDDQLMLVKMEFEEGSVGATHSHPHTQVTYIVSGRYNFTNGDETREVGPGDSLHFAPDVPHGALCLEAGTVIDVFTPCRKDFL